MALLGLLAAAVAPAQTTYTWTGLAGDGLFDTPGNWQGGVVPTGSSTDHIVFGVYPLQYLYLTTAINVGDITFSGIQDGFYLNQDAPYTATITLNGNVATTAGSQYWGLFGAPLVLAAGNHDFSPGGNADLYIFSTVSGAGGLTLNGPNNLIVASYGNTYTGGTTINAGILFVGADGALGTGPITVDGGTLATSYGYGTTTLANDFVLGANPTFGSYVPDNQTLWLGAAGSTTVTPVNGVTTVNFNLRGNGALLINGDMADGSGPTSYVFNGDFDSLGFVLSGNNTYTGGTLVVNGNAVVFSGNNSIPASGLIEIQPGAYAGLGNTSITPAGFLGAIDAVNSGGTIGFDNGNTYTGPLDLSGFSNPNISIGTRSAAFLDSLITPVSGTNTYRFQGSGVLSLIGSNPLTGGNAVQVSSDTGRTPLTVVLAQTTPNDYTGLSSVVGAGLVFDADSSLPAGAILELVDGYAGVTDTSGYTLAELVATNPLLTGNGVLGYDSSSYFSVGYLGGTLNASPVDFSSLTQDLYLGSASITTYSGTITTANGGAGDYFLAGFGGGQVTVTSLLTGARALHVGLPGAYQNPNDYLAYPMVTLTNASNNFTGGTILNSGQLEITDSAALGTGDVTVDASTNWESTAYLGVPSNSTFANNIVLTSGTLGLFGYQSNYAGVISGSGTLYPIDYLTLSGNNTFTGGTMIDGYDIIADNDSALGAGSVIITDGGSVTFGSATPQIGSLLLGDPYTGDGTYYAALNLAASGTTTLTINQTNDGVFGGAIIETGSVGSLVKTGPASLYVSGDQNFGVTPYSGGTTILQGKLIAGSADALGTGTITINGGLLDAADGVALTNLIAFGANGGTLGGGGSIGSPVTAGTNVVIAPGNSPGTLTFTSGLTLAPGGQLDFEIQSAGGPAGSGYDLVDVSAGLLDITATSGSPFTIRLISLDAGAASGNVSDFNSAIGYTWLIFRGNNAGGLTGYNPSSFVLDTTFFTNPLNGGVFSFTQGPDGVNPGIYLNFSPVPEPTTWLLLALGLGSVAVTWRRRRA